MHISYSRRGGCGMWRIREYERRLHRRLLVLVPVSILALALLLLTLDKSRVVERIFTVGYEGPESFVPEITIIDESGIESDANAVERDAMKVNDVLIESEPIVDREKLGETPSEDIRDPYASLQRGIADTDDLFRTYPTRARVPYREDYVIIKMVQPEYPPAALERGLEGYVLVEAYIDADGLVEGVWVRSAYGDESFETSALAAVEQFVFKPAKQRGEPVPFWVSFLIRFELRL
ncbi:MAG TPA: energy transducer TonB [Candidatus Eisenbacteria bacterium]|uniref:Energy transducer TonB n=1 Tax=Eiseniibacteriota bacterium TaxID=2212470 RepID=A0A7V2F445_UNCEI|nr:energy transducer TonB [Candidatus Eisenbacteria bacterium]